MAVYFLSAPDVGRIKIGFAMVPEDRMKSIRLMSPVPVKIIDTVSGGRTREQLIHKKLDRFRRHGEWFEDCLEVRRCMIESVAEDLSTLPLQKLRELHVALTDILKEKMGE